MRVWGVGLLLPSYGGPGVSPQKIFENIGANLCNTMLFFGKKKSAYLKNLVFNLDFGRSV